MERNIYSILVQMFKLHVTPCFNYLPSLHISSTYFIKAPSLPVLACRLPIITWDIKLIDPPALIICNTILEQNVTSLPGSVISQQHCVRFLENVAEAQTAFPCHPGTNILNPKIHQFVLLGIWDHAPTHKILTKVNYMLLVGKLKQKTQKRLFNETKKAKQCNEVLTKFQ